MKRRFQYKCFPVSFAKFLSTELLLTDVPPKPEIAVHVCPKKLLFEFYLENSKEKPTNPPKVCNFTEKRNPLNAFYCDFFRNFSE